MLKIGADVWLNGTDGDKLPRHHQERIERGFSEYDWWNFNSYIAGVVATAVLKCVDGYGYFAINTKDYEEDTEEDFKATCGAIYYALTEYLRADYEWADDMNERYEEAREAMILFAENLGSWWD